MFDLYANKRLGSRAIANWLTERGHGPSGGRPWTFRSVLTILRNRACVGEVFFRGKWHSAPHPHLVDPTTFAATQQLLAERSEDHAKRRTNGSEYLLGGIVVCQCVARSTSKKPWIVLSARSRSRKVAKVPLQFVSGELAQRLRLAGLYVPHLLSVPLDRAWAAAHHPEFEQPLPHQRPEAEVVRLVMASALSLQQGRLLPVLVNPDAV